MGERVSGVECRGEEKRNIRSLSSLLSALGIFTRHSSLDPSSCLRILLGLAPDKRIGMTL
jgi:hypothetical protein